VQASSRRHLLRQAAVLAVVGSSTTHSLAGALSGANQPGQKEWFDSWLASKPPHGALHLYRFADEIYALTKPIAWTPAPDTKTNFPRVDVPVGFITDFASVPRIFWSVLPRDGRYTYPAIVHDYMYWVQKEPRSLADEIFKIGMEEFGIDFVTVNAIYWSVRAAGGWAWDDNAALKKRGERRIIRRVPSDPLIEWAEWKKDASVFE
jgi:uncharacterized protein DUF1353